ncbi:MAG: hypothetical protein U0892_16025 [Pirellulales bacterium]
MQKRSKRLKVRLSRFEQLEARQMFAAAIWSNVLQSLDVYPNDIVTPLDALLIINEINNPSYADRTTSLAGCIQRTGNAAYDRRYVTSM